jgi:N-carbamoyl-L-amino-acid hydrolase
MDVLAQVVDIIENLPKEVYGCKLSFEKHRGRTTIKFDDAMLGFVENSVKKLGYTNKGMYSGAGHDAQYVAEMLPAVMIFIPSKDGLSHTVVEHSSPEQTWQGANVLLNAILEADAVL